MIVHLTIQGVPAARVYSKYVNGLSITADESSHPRHPTQLSPENSLAVFVVMIPIKNCHRYA